MRIKTITNEMGDNLDKSIKEIGSTIDSAIKKVGSKIDAEKSENSEILYDDLYLKSGDEIKKSFQVFSFLIEVVSIKKAILIFRIAFS